ncbi:AP-1 complex subunit sigma [Aspergillus foveolatus]
MAIHYLILLSRQGKVRLAKWFTTLSPKEKAKIIKDVTQLVLSRRTRMCNFLEYKDTKVVYRRYASLFFIAGCASTDNELITLEIVHRYVEQMDKYYGNVCELDIIFNFQKAYFILDELLLAGEMQESSKKNVLRCISQQDSLEDMEVSPKCSCYFTHALPSEGYRDGDVYVVACRPLHHLQSSPSLHFSDSSLVPPDPWQHCLYRIFDFRPSPFNHTTHD